VSRAICGRPASKTNENASPQMDIAKTAAFVLDEEEALNEDISRFR